MFQGSLMVVSRKFQGCFEGVLRVFQLSFNVFFGKCQGRFREVTWMFQESYEEDLRVF